ncbi:MAG: thiamine-phosphate kinase [Acidobacteria bacterium]|nr:thiamine-phosphate kinase [Acidobacteriota bacterium]
MPKFASENRLIQLLRDRYSINVPLIKKGIGDDAAVIRPKHAGEYLLITTDMLLEGIDFRREWTDPRRLGFKSVAVNMSDLAAMGAKPLFFTVSLAIPSGISRRWIMDFYDGMAEPDSNKGAYLIGGDLSRSENGIMISITALGESLNRKVLYRSGGKAGDILYVTGVLGRSAAGLKLLQDGCLHPKSRSRQEAIRAHQRPEPRCETGIWLAQSGLVHCMIDLSDGVSTDLPRMCAASGTGAEIFRNDLPIFKEAREWECDPVELALHGGEDFELLFAVPKSKSRLLENRYPSKYPEIKRIGRLTPDSGKIWITEPGNKRLRLMDLGYDHFRLQS